MGPMTGSKWVVDTFSRDIIISGPFSRILASSCRVESQRKAIIGATSEDPEAAGTQ